MIDATPLLRIYAAGRRRALQSQGAAVSQGEQLTSLIHRAAQTKFGRDHDFSRLHNVADYQAAVPLRRYDAMWREYWQPVFPVLDDCSWPRRIPFFALSSGTSQGTSKYVPCTSDMNRANSRAGMDLLVHHLANRPGSRVMGGKIFLLGGSTGLTKLADGVYGGDLSGIAASRAPVWARRFRFPPPELALIEDWEQKIAALNTAVLDQDIRVIAGTPSWLLIFFERLFATRPNLPPRLKAFFPNLELLVHGGVNFAPYRPQFEVLLENSNAETRESYAASEGFIAVADRGPGEGMRLITDNGIFYEFIPVSELETPKPARHWVGNFETGVDYAIAVTTCAGLWSYLIGDTVRFLERTPPRLVITGRVSYMLSSFGEHLTGEEIENAVAQAASELGIAVSDFSVGTVFPGGETPRGGHLYVVEFARPPGPTEARRFTDLVDFELCRCNDDYKVHRSGGFGMDPPRLLAVQKGTFANWMKSRGRLGGQNKVPRVINDQTLFQSLRRFCQDDAA
ncbi:MAG TPA: GH3 auxin-responsive promoter family protein [Micropepsaceae bacterium]|nr:GH3 auxin-responsive promoter family protein [Micropepsaceae bacterium]